VGLDGRIGVEVLPPRSGLVALLSFFPWAGAHGYMQSPRSGLDALVSFLQWVGVHGRRGAVAAYP